MNIDEMQAGREMNALVAERVMGLVWDETRCRVCGWPLYETVEQGCTKDNCSERPSPKRRADEPAHYSTEIGAAWPIVEKMQLDGYGFQLHADIGRAPLSGLYGKWYWFSVFPKDGRFRSEYADTAPLAICRAALKTVGMGD